MSPILNTFTQTTTLTHQYNTPGIYKINIDIYGVPDKKISTSTTVRVIDIRPVTNPVITLFNIPSVTLSDKIPVIWKLKGNYYGKGMYIVLRDMDGRAIKSKIVTPSQSILYMNINEMCNDFFGDIMDKDCSKLKSSITKGKTSYYIEAALFTPKDACFGFCASFASNIKPVIITKVKSNTFEIKNPNQICTTEYNPVCGLPNFECPTGAVCNRPLEVTYSNICKLKLAGATFVRDGECKSPY